MKKIYCILLLFSFSLFAEKVGDREFSYPEDLSEWAHAPVFEENQEIHTYLTLGKFSQFFVNAFLKEGDERDFIDLTQTLQKNFMSQNFRLENAILKKTRNGQIFHSKIFIDNIECGGLYQKMIEGDEGIYTFHYMFVIDPEMEDLEACKEKILAWQNFIKELS